VTKITKKLRGWKYPIFYRDEHGSDAHPNLNEIVTDLLIEEGVPKRLIYTVKRYRFLDFHARVDNSVEPKSVLILVCTHFEDQKDGFSYALTPIMNISIRKENGRRSFLPLFR
jgi:hypothetical protein